MLLTSAARYRTRLLSSVVFKFKTANFNSSASTIDALPCESNEPRDIDEFAHGLDRIDEFVNATGTNSSKGLCDNKRHCLREGLSRALAASWNITTSDFTEVDKLQACLDAFNSYMEPRVIVGQEPMTPKFTEVIELQARPRLPIATHFIRDTTAPVATELFPANAKLVLKPPLKRTASTFLSSEDYQAIRDYEATHTTTGRAKVIPEKNAANPYAKTYNARN